MPESSGPGWDEAAAVMIMTAREAWPSPQTSLGDGNQKQTRQASDKAQRFLLPPALCSLPHPFLGHTASPIRWYSSDLPVDIYP